MACQYKPETVWDCLVIGTGATGLSSLINGCSEGLKMLAIDRSSLTGGLIGTTSMIENYPGFPDGIEGRVLTNRMTEQAMKFGAEFMMNTRVHSVKKDESTALFKTEVETLYEPESDRSILPIYSRSVVLASGRNHKRLGISNESELVKAGKLQYGHPETHIPIKGTICIIGGGNSAGQAATWLTKEACAVVLATPRLDAMSQYLIDRINSSKSYVEVVYGHVIAINHMTGDVLVHIKQSDGSHITKSVDKVYCLIGLEVDDTFREMKSDTGFLYTEIPGIVVAGDCREQSEKRCTAAVGEGVIALGQIHKYLSELKRKQEAGVLINQNQ